MAQKSIAECVIYWDYENCPIPSGTNLGRVIDVIKSKIIQKLGGRSLPFRDIQLYVSKNGKHAIHPKVLSSLDTLGVDYIPIECQKPETVDKRILADIGLNIFDWKDNKYNAIVVISGDKDFGYLLSKIKQRHIAKTIVIPRLFIDGVKKINLNYPNAPEIWIDYDAFDQNEFNDICPEVIHQNHISATHRANCIYYHPAPKPIHRQRDNDYEEKMTDHNEDNTQKWLQGKVCVHVPFRCNSNKKRTNRCTLIHVNANTVHLPCHWEKKCGFCHNHHQCIFAIHQKTNKQTHNNPYVDRRLLQNNPRAHLQSDRVESGGSYDQNHTQHKPQVAQRAQRSRSYDNDESKETEHSPQNRKPSIKDLVCIFAPNCKNKLHCKYAHPTRFQEKGLYYCQRAAACKNQTCLNFNNHQYPWKNSKYLEKPKEYICQFFIIGKCNNNGYQCTMHHPRH